MTSAGTLVSSRFPTVGAIGPARMPCRMAATCWGSRDIEFNRLSNGPFPVRGARFMSQAKRLATGRARCMNMSSGMKVKAATGSAHSRTGISMTSP